MVYFLYSMPAGSAFERVYKKFSLPLTKFIAKRMGASPREVEIVFEETVVAAWKGLHTFRHKSTYFTWLCRIALNKIADYYRDQVNRNSKVIVPLIEGVTQIDTKTLLPEEALALKQLKQSVNDCLDLLPPEKRRLLQFRYWYDMSYSQIGKVLGISDRAVEGKLYRARREFKEVWSTQKS